MAAARLPPVCRTDAAAIWAEPANVVAEKAIVANGPRPASRAMIP
jgi:hypothetical protein